MAKTVGIELGSLAERDDPCAALLADVAGRRRAAEAARTAAHNLAERLTAARADDDAHRRALERADGEADPAAIRTWRKRARAAFQAARSGAPSAEAVAIAGGAWLAEVDRLNAVAAEAAGRVERERAASEIASVMVGRLAAEWEAAERAAEAAEAEWDAASRAAASCAEAGPTADEAGPTVAEAGPTVAEAEPTVAEAGPTAAAANPAQPAGIDWNDTVGNMDGAAQAPPMLAPGGPSRLGPEAAISRILAGDIGRLDPIVAQLSLDEDDARRWRARLVDLLETILLRAVDATAVSLPPGHPFWGAFTAEQSRDILAALAAIGYHFDGLGGWLDERVPNQRDLSIAVAHAGLDPMRIRHWPTSEEAAQLVRDVDVLAAPYLAAIAPSLTVRELTAVLGQGGGRLDELWQDWDRVRPLLLATD